MDEVHLAEQATRFLAAITTRYNLPERDFSHEPCTLVFGEGHVITLYPQIEGLRSLIMHAAVGVMPLSSAKLSAFLIELANANDAWSMTNGATLGMEKETGIVSLWQRFALPYGVDEEALEAIEVLLGTAEHWRGVVSSFGGQALFQAGEVAGGERNPATLIRA